MSSKGKTVSQASRKKATARRPTAAPFDRWLERALKALNESWGEAPTNGHGNPAGSHKKARN